MSFADYSQREVELIGGPAHGKRLYLPSRQQWYEHPAAGTIYEYERISASTIYRVGYFAWRRMRRRLHAR